MANEATVRLSVQINKDNLRVRTDPTVFRFDVPSARPASPGLVTATVAGADVDFSALDLPGPCWMQNLSEDFPVEYGVHDGTKFHPVGWLKPGMVGFMYLSPNLGEEPDAPTGTASGTDTVVNTFRVRGVGGSADVDVRAWESDE